MTDKIFDDPNPEDSSEKPLNSTEAVVKPAAIDNLDDSDESGGGAGKRKGGDYKREKLLRLIDKGMFKARNFGNFLNKQGMDEHTVKETTVTHDVHERDQAKHEAVEEENKKHWEDLEATHEADDTIKTEKSAEDKRQEAKQEAEKEQVKLHTQNNPDSTTARTQNPNTASEAHAQFFVSPEHGADQTRRLMRGEGQGVRQSTANTNNHLGVAIQGGEVASALKSLRAQFITNNTNATKQNNQQRGSGMSEVVVEKENTSGNRPKSRL